MQIILKKITSFKGLVAQFHLFKIIPKAGAVTWVDHDEYVYTVLSSLIVIFRTHLDTPFKKIYTKTKLFLLFYCMKFVFIKKNGYKIEY